MAYIPRTKVKKPKRNNWLWYTVGAVGFVVISGLLYHVFSVDIDPIEYQLTEVKEVPLSATQNNGLSEIEQISISPHSGAESIVYVNGKFQKTTLTSPPNLFLSSGTIYTGTEDWKILRIRDSKVEVFHDLLESNYSGFSSL